MELLKILKLNDCNYFQHIIKCYSLKYHNSGNTIYREKSIPMTALWCPAFSNHG